MANQKNLSDSNLIIPFDTTPSLAEQLSAIALHLVDLDDLGAVCLLLGREIAKLNLGAALIVQHFTDVADRGQIYATYCLCDPGSPSSCTGQNASEPFFLDDQATLADQIARVNTDISLGQEFTNLLNVVLPNVHVGAADQGTLLRLTPLSPESGFLIIWGEDLQSQDIVPLSAFASMLGLALKGIANASRQDYHYQTEQETLLDISRILLQGAELRPMLGEVTEIIQQTLESDLSTIYLYDSAEQSFVPYGAAGWLGGPNMHVSFGESTDRYPSGSAYAYHKRQPVIIDDEHTEHRFGVPDFVLSMGIRSVVMVPILLGSREVIGVITCSDRRVNSFNEQDVRLLSLIANSTAQTIDRLRLYQDTQRQINELSILYQVAQLASDATDEDELLQQVTDIIHQTLYSDEFGFVLLNNDQDGLLPHPAYHAGQEAEMYRKVALDASSIVGQVFTTQSPLRISDVLQYSNYIAATLGMRSELCIPLIAHGEILGVINAESRYLDYFSDQDEKLLSAISGQIASALQRLRHYAQEHRRGAQIESLRLATSTLASSLDLEEVLTNILDQLESLIICDSACIFLKEEQGLLAVAGKGFANIEEIVGHYFSAEQDLYREIERTGRPLILADTRDDSRFHGWANTFNTRSWLGVPMHGRGGVIGYITIDGLEPGVFTSAQADLAQPFADQAAMVIENARLFESERRQLVLAQAQQEIGHLLTSQLALGQVLETILDALNRVVPSDSASIMLVDENGQVLLSAERNLNPTPEMNDFVKLNIKVTSAKFAGDDVVMVADTLTDPRWVQQPGNPVRSWVGAMLSIQNKPIGLLNIDSRQPNAFDASILPIVRSFANQAAVAIHNARMFDLTQQSLNVTEILYSTAHALIETTDLESVLRIIANQSRNAVEADMVTVYLVDMSTKWVGQIARAVGKQITIEVPDSLDAQTLYGTLNDSPEGESLRQRRPIRLAAEPDQAPNRRMIVPLVFQEAPLGLIVAQNRPDQPEFTQHQLDLLMAIGNQAATAITSMQLFIALDAEKSQLELRVTERTQDLARANEQLKELDRLKSEFIANVSHELRTPLTNIKLYLSLLSRNSADSQKVHLSVLKEQTDQLQQLIETVLDLSYLDTSLESENDRKIPVELGRLIISLIQEMQPRAKAKGIDLTILALSNRAYVQGDRALLTQAFENLILNALNYTPDNGSVSLQVRRDQNQVVITITDTGVGIPLLEQPLIFDRFYRGQQAVDANISGTGLGLSIVKEIIEHHKGQIEVVSQLGQGSTFIVRLPSISEAP